MNQFSRPHYVLLALQRFWLPKALQRDLSKPEMAVDSDICSSAADKKHWDTWIAAFKVFSFVFQVL